MWRWDEFWPFPLTCLSPLKHSRSASVWWSLRMRGVTWSGAKMIHIFEISAPNLVIHFVTYRALRRRLSHVIGENGVYPIATASRLQTSPRMCSITWPMHYWFPKTKVVRAPAALNFADDTGWDTDKPRAPKWRRTVCRVRKVLYSFLVIGSDYNSLLQLFIYFSSVCRCYNVY